MADWMKEASIEQILQLKKAAEERKKSYNKEDEIEAAQETIDFYNRMLGHES